SLPYASLLEDEANDTLNEIVEQLCSSAKARDWSPGCAYWVKQLNGYLDLRHPLTRKTRAQLAKVLFELVITPGIDASYAEVFANTCKLIKTYYLSSKRKKEKLGVEDLTLPWEPLFNIIHKTFFPKSRQKTLVSESYPRNATEDILAKVLPLFNASSIGDAFTVQAYLVRFLPTRASTSPKYSPSVWLPTIFSFWCILPGSLMYQTEFIDLLARVAEDNVDVEVSNPGQIGIFTLAQVKTVFATGAKMMDLPVGSTSNGNSNSGRGSVLGWSKMDHKTGLEPSLIFPGLLERVYPSLETLTETHRTTSSISTLSLLANPLFSRAHYPAGGKHLAPLLHLTIPGIDMNDPVKTISSLIFLVHAIMGIPLIDLTEGSSNMSGFRWSGVDVDERDDQMEIDEEEEDALCKASTAEFEEWLAKFLGRFEYLPANDRGKKNLYNMETGLHACEVVGIQMSEKLQDMALKMVINFVSTTILQNASKPMGYLCSTLTSPNRKKALDQFIPLCHANIMSELHHGASSTPTSSTHHIQSDTTLHWYQCILYHVVMSSGADLLGHKNDLLDLAKEMNVGTLMKNHHKHWVQPGDPKNINVDWHIPSDPELNFAMEILDTFLRPTIQKIQNLMDHGTDENGKVLNNREMTHEFCRHLSVVRNCLSGMTTLVEDDGDIEATDYIDDESESVSPTKGLYVGYCFIDPKDPRREISRQLRKDLGFFLHKLVTYFRNSREDDVDSLKILLKIMKIYLTDRGVEKSKYEASKRGHQYAKGMLKTPHHDKKYPRYLLVKRAYQQHLCRLKQNAHGRVRTKLHDDLLLDLIELSLSSYSEIRKISQSYLITASRCFIGVKPLIIPKLLKALEPGEQHNPKRMKGALYLLGTRTYMYTCLRDWRFVPSFITRICQAQHEDKPSVQEMIRKVFYDYLLNYNNTAFKAITTDGLNDAVSQAMGTLSLSFDEEKLQRIQCIIEKRMQLQKTRYFELVDTLLELVNSNTLHWRFASMAANFLDFLSQLLLDLYFENIRHPYKQVRDVLAANINLLIQIQWHPSANNVDEILESNVRTGDGVGFVPVTPHADLKQRIEGLVQSLEKWRAEKKPTAAGSSEYGNASKTVLSWLYDALTIWQASGTYPLFIPLLPSVFLMQDVNDDQDLQSLATHVLNIIASFAYPPDMVPPMVKRFVEILTETPSWHIRVKALPVLQVFFFKHLFMLSEEEMIRVMDVVSGMMKDTQIEVRQLAAVTLSGLIRCSQRDAIDTLKHQFYKLLETKIPAKKQKNQMPRAALPRDFQEAVLIRHAGVLGLSCLVDAFPYEVPKWMPEVLVKLADCISDPVPIQTAVKKTFTDFRRTHQDTWHEDMKQFTEDQLSLLSDMLISPSYYA
ncbi:9710_t:CDS:10, partial [Acaulospora colombiana]